MWKDGDLAQGKVDSTFEIIMEGRILKISNIKHNASKSAMEQSVHSGKVFPLSNVNQKELILECDTNSPFYKKMKEVFEKQKVKYGIDLGKKIPTLLLCIASNPDVEAVATKKTFYMGFMIFGMIDKVINSIPDVDIMLNKTTQE